MTDLEPRSAVTNALRTAGNAVPREALEDEIAGAVVPALFVALIISRSGNSGSQASTLVIRTMALEEVGLGDWWRGARWERGSCSGEILTTS